MEGRYWCHMCSRTVRAVMDSAELKCPLCDSGFVEEIAGDGGAVDSGDLGSGRALSLHPPAAAAELRAPPAAPGPAHRHRPRRRKGPCSLVDPFDQSILLPPPFDGHRRRSSDEDAPVGAILGDYLVGSGLDQLLQHLAENDSNQYGTPPAQREAVEALPTVTVKEENLGCPVCLEDFQCGAEAREMPCKHRFHGTCILPWLELHSSCPVCRFQIPAGGSKETHVPESAGGGSENLAAAAAGDGADRRSSWLPMAWPFNGLFSLSGSQGSGNPSSSASGTSRSHEDDS
ncbi:unnamed protein product [Spirodela intermedia]|uniref:RING-type E3 ubiquitin transferase n=1 Tax=Spirodela intermedia TaxID=51605 RepID=A0A7I8IAE8_SPIIN|nr:unnamed protein product [Spirodela intermedia]CAA6654508.1 unnamed protein product [Spirodela intermedia]